MAKTVKIFEDGYEPLAEKEQYPKCKISPDNNNILIVTVDDIFMGARCVLEYIIKNGKIINKKVVYNKTDQPVPKYTNSFILAEYESLMYQLYGSSYKSEEKESTKKYVKEIEEPEEDEDNYIEEENNEEVKEEYNTRRIKTFENVNYVDDYGHGVTTIKNDKNSKQYTMSKLCVICGNTIDILKGVSVCDECLRRLRPIIYPDKNWEINE